MEVPGYLRRQVVKRADDRCEYCGLSQAGQEAVFHIDHVKRRRPAFVILRQRICNPQESFDAVGSLTRSRWKPME